MNVNDNLTVFDMNDKRCFMEHTNLADHSGRPYASRMVGKAKAPGLRKDKVIQIRLTPTQYREWSRLAAARGLPIGTWARLVILDELERREKQQS